MAKAKKTKSSKAESPKPNTIRMFRDLILIRSITAKNDKTDGGIWIPDSVDREDQVLFWEVLEVGKAVRDIKKGDQIVTHQKTGGQEFNFNGEDLIVMRERNVCGIIG